MTGKRLYIGNLPYSATDQTLRDTFSQCGTVESVDLIIDRETGRAKGFAFVQMSTPEEALAAVQSLDGRDFDGRAMKVNEAKPARAASEFGRRS